MTGQETYELCIQVTA